MVLFVGDDWAEDHHDVEVQDATGRRLGKARLSEGVAGIERLHALIGQFADPDDETGSGQVLVGIETDRGPWVTALVTAGYRVFAINPMQVARYRERHSTSGAKSDAATRRAELRGSGGRSRLSRRVVPAEDPFVVEVEPKHLVVQRLPEGGRG